MTEIPTGPEGSPQESAQTSEAEALQQQLSDIHEAVGEDSGSLSPESSLPLPDMDQVKDKKVNIARRALNKVVRPKDRSKDHYDYDVDGPVAIAEETDRYPEEEIPDVSVEEELDRSKPDRHLKLSPEDEKLVKDAKDIGEQAFEKSVQTETLRVLRELQAKQTMALMDKKDALAQLRPDEGDIVPAIVAHYDDVINELQQEREATPQKIREELEEKRRATQKEKLDTMLEVRAFERNSDPKFVYEPSEDVDPKEAIATAGLTSKMLRKSDEPRQIDDYTVKDKDGNYILMQRLVFEAQNGYSVIVEDWDATNGVLKRQAVLKGGITRDNRGGPLFVPQELRGAKKLFSSKETKNKLVLNEERYSKDVGLLSGSQDITKKTKVSPFPSPAYRGRLAQVGMSSTWAEAAASGRHGKKKSKGFIKMLQENLAKGSKG